MSVLLGTDTCKKCGMKNSRNQDGHCAHCGAKVDTDDRIPLELQAEPLNKALRVFERMQKGFAIPGVRQGIHRVADVGDHPSGGKRVLMRGPGEQAKTNYNNWSGPVSHISPHPDQSGVPSGHGVFNVHFSDKTKPVVAGMLHEHAKKLPGYPSSLAKSLTVFDRMMKGGPGSGPRKKLFSTDGREVIHRGFAGHTGWQGEEHGVKVHHTPPNSAWNHKQTTSPKLHALSYVRGTSHDDGMGTYQADSGPAHPLLHLHMHREDAREIKNHINTSRTGRNERPREWPQVEPIKGVKHPESPV